jgi:hypothetical protein
MMAWKLFTNRSNGTLGPLFINRTQVIPIGVWLDAEDHPTPGYAHRPGWHVSAAPHAPHLSRKRRVWKAVEIEDYEQLDRPQVQGGTWFIAQRMRVLP